MERMQAELYIFFKVKAEKLAKHYGGRALIGNQGL